MMGYKYILRGHEAIPTDSLEEWARMYEAQHRIVKQEYIGEIKVSTVFLGIDHSFGEGPLLLFETMIFKGKHDGYQDRCSTWDEAEEMHKKAVAMVRP